MAGWSVVRWLGGLAVAAILGGPALAQTPQPAALEPAQRAAAPAWSPQCTGQGAERRCSVGATVRYADPDGDAGSLSLRLVRDAACTTLHIVFDGTIAVERPVTVAVDGGEPQAFYTGAELEALAVALDEGGTPAGAPPEFRRFLAQASAEAMAAERSAEEMMARFAAIKESWRLGVSCGPMRRLMPQIAGGRTLRLDFTAAPAAPTRVYHWPALLGRGVAVDVAGLAGALDAAFRDGTPSAQVLPAP